MSKIKKTLVASLLLSAQSVAAIAGKPDVVLDPASKWRIDYGTNECRLIRNFGSAEPPVTFQLSRIDPNPTSNPDLSLVSPDLIPTAALRKVRVSAEGQKEQKDEMGYIIRSGDGVPPILFVNEAKEFADLLKADIAAGRSSLVTISVGRSTTRLALGKMAQPLAAMQSCMDDLVKSWGYDPIVQSTLSSPPLPVTPIPRWLSPSDYPATAARELQSGGVKARLDIDNNGVIIGCHVMVAGGSKVFEKLTCDLFMKNGRFKPALQKDGTPVASFLTFRVFWKISVDQSFI